MAAALDLVIGMRHGDTCTCTPLDPITMTAHPVVVSPDCPAQTELPQTRDEITGRVVITWPRSSNLSLNARDVEFQDFDTGEVLTTVLGMRLHIGDRRGWAHLGAVEVDLLQLADADGNPLGAYAAPVPNEDNSAFRTATFRYLVAEMRVTSEHVEP